MAGQTIYTTMKAKRPKKEENEKRQKEDGKNRFKLISLPCLFKVKYCNLIFKYWIEYF